MTTTILITGAAGPLGRHIVSRLLQRTRATLLCLVPRGPGVSPEERLRALVLEASGQGPGGELDRAALERLRVIACDRTAELPRLAEEARELDGVDEVWHAEVRLGPARWRSTQVHRDDVAGTQTLLDFIESRRVPVLNLVSSTYVAGARAGKIPEEPFDDRIGPVNLFEETKRIAEVQAVERCRAAGTRWRIFRVPLVTDWRLAGDGACDDVGSLFEILCRFKQDVDAKALGYFKQEPLRLLAGEGAGPHLIRADRAADLMVRIASNERCADGYFHVVSPGSSPLGPLCERIGTALDVRIELVTDTSALNAIDDLLHRRLAGLHAYLHDAREFESSRALAAAGAATGPAAAAGRTEEDALQVEAFCQSWHAARLGRVRAMRGALETMERRTLDGGADGALDYHVGGTGETTLIFLNALGQGLFMWSWLLLHFPQRYRVIAWEPRGTSGSRPLGLSDQVADLARIVAREGVERCRLLCWCNATRVALEFVAQKPIVSSMVFINGSFKPIKGLERLYTAYEQTMGQLCDLVSKKPDLAPMVMKSLSAFFSGGAGSPAPGGPAAARLDPVAVLKQSSDEIKATLGAPFTSRQTTVNYGCQIADFNAHDITAAIQAVTVPVLFITGELDQVASPGMSRAVAAQMRDSHCVEIVGGTHYCMQESPELVIDLIESFFASPQAFRHESAEIHHGSRDEARPSR